MQELKFKLGDRVKVTSDKTGEVFVGRIENINPYRAPSMIYAVELDDFIPEDIIFVGEWQLQREYDVNELKAYMTMWNELKNIINTNIEMDKQRDDQDSDMFYGSMLTSKDVLCWMMDLENDYQGEQQ